MQKHVYDFDNTIYAGDSGVHFYLYCARRWPKILLDLPAVGIAGLRYRCGAISKTAFKERLYRFLQRLPDVDGAVADFWRSHRKNIKAWYLAQREETDLIISASPEFVLRPICESLGVELIASRVDKHSGKFDGLNCHDEEKVVRMLAAYPDMEMTAFYSDSLADTPLARMAKSAYRVRGNRISPFFAKK